MHYRFASTQDAAALAVLNHALIRDEQHRNRTSVAELETRMAGWLAGEYRAVLFEEAGQPVGYALFRHDPEHVYLRQFFVRPESRRRGLGRAAMAWLRQHAWAGETRIRVEVLVGNTAGIAFWRAVGFTDYCLTLESNGAGREASGAAESVVAWVSLVGGVPASPKSDDLDELASTPGPADFFLRLFADLCGVTELPSHVTEEHVVPREERVTAGFSGTKEIGYRFVESECLATSAVPCDVVVETRGLPGMEVRWHYCLDRAGQAGHAAFRHVSLEARFDDLQAERRFAEVWRTVFGTVPLWAAAPGP